jgi:hypothetical protein
MAPQLLPGSSAASGSLGSPHLHRARGLPTSTPTLPRARADRHAWLTSSLLELRRWIRRTPPLLHPPSPSSSHCKSGPAGVRRGRAPRPLVEVLPPTARTATKLVLAGRIRRRGIRSSAVRLSDCSLQSGDLNRSQAIQRVPQQNSSNRLQSRPYGPSQRIAPCNSILPLCRRLPRCKLPLCLVSRHRDALSIVVLNAAAGLHVIFSHFSFSLYLSCGRWARASGSGSHHWSSLPQRTRGSGGHDELPLSEHVASGGEAPGDRPAPEHMAISGAPTASSPRGSTLGGGIGASSRRSLRRRSVRAARKIGGA